MAKPLMFQGTGSDVGKSVIVAGLCRLLHLQGINVAPFKPQNMSLNAFVTEEGGEMGRAQVLQAQAAGLKPHVDMNPVLLKPTTDVGAQVILCGKVHSNMKAREYHEFKPSVMKTVLAAYQRLSALHDVILIEGAGSPAEINLRKGDVANMGFALEIGCPVILIGDIDKGGVFASIVGTMELIAREERELIKGFVINKFRGDPSLLKPAYEQVTSRTGKPFLGTVPFFTDLCLPEEDGIHRGFFKSARRNGKIRVAVVILDKVSNFSDFDPFLTESDVSLEYVRQGDSLGKADLIILPGSKNTINDLIKLKNCGLYDEIIKNHSRGAFVIGICGGYQMLGNTVADPFNLEGGEEAAQGLGLLDVNTTMMPEKITVQATAEIIAGELPWHAAGSRLNGYEIHFGESILGPDAKPLLSLVRNGETACRPDGAVSRDGKVFGCYLHGLFDNDEFRSSLLNQFRNSPSAASSFAEAREQALNRLADIVSESINVEALQHILESNA